MSNHHVVYLKLILDDKCNWKINMYIYIFKKKEKEIVASVYKFQNGKRENEIEKQTNEK